MAIKLSPSSLRSLFIFFQILLLTVAIAFNISSTASDQSSPNLPIIKSSQGPYHQLKQFSQKFTPQKPVSLTDQQITDFINQLRSDSNLHSLETDHSICPTINRYLFETEATNLNDIQQSLIKSLCPECLSAALVSFTNQFSNSSTNPWVSDPDFIDLITKDFGYLCITHQQTTTFLTFLSFQTDKPLSSTSPSSITTQNIINFSESQLWQALVDYRHAHHKPDLLASEDLCRYARERVTEHLDMFTSKAKSEYPVADKYPLDAHAGFQRDGESGYLFEVAKFNIIAENLAYYPHAQYPNQVIEWGWDTSTEGHREAQLSEEFTHACLTGRDGFFVALFAKN